MPVGVYSTLLIVAHYNPVDTDRTKELKVKTMRMFGLVVVAAIAAMAFIGSSTAAAEIHEGIGLCKANEPILCKAGNLITVPSGGSIDVSMTAEAPILKGTLTEKCNTSATTFNTTEEDKNPVLGHVTALSFSGACTPCSTVKTLGLPYEAKLSMTEPGETGDYVLTSSGGAELSGCTFGVTCKFEGTGVTLLGKNTTSGIEFKAEEEELKQTGGSALFCGSVGKWTANYKGAVVELLTAKKETIKDSPVWLTLLEKK